MEDAPDPARPIPPLHQVLDDIPRQEQILGHDATMRGLAVWVTIGFFALIFAVVGIALSGRELGTIASLLFTLLGVVGAKWGTVMDFYFGSSAGSARKSTVIGSALTKATNDKEAASA